MSLTEVINNYDEAIARLGPMGLQRNTFCGTPRVFLDQPETLSGFDVVIVGAPYDGGAKFKPGTRLGPEAIRCADYLPMVPYRPHLSLGIDPFSILKVGDGGDVDMPHTDINIALERLEEAVGAVAVAGCKPIVLGGDHSIALADMRGLARRHGPGGFALLHFDAHADTGDEPFGPRVNHATAMRRAVEENLPSAGGFVQVGLRGYWPEPENLEWADARGLRRYTMQTIDDRGLRACLIEIVEALSRFSGVFLSIDIDVVDPAMAPGTGTPEPGGLTSRQILEAVRFCCSKLEVVGMELVEVSPPLDGAGQPTAMLANRVVVEALCGMACHRLEARQ